ncbi:helix-turn-helix transcriptional regulator [Vibrio tapetis]|nr:LuxR C-terminal-related transcriptional regulator [Vibrio tapetis]
MDAAISHIQQLEIANMFEHCGDASFYAMLEQVFQSVIPHQAFFVINCLPNQAEMLYHYGPKTHKTRLTKLLDGIKHPHQLKHTHAKLYRPLHTGDFPSRDIFSFQWKHHCHALHIHDQLVITPPATQQDQNIWIVLDLLDDFPTFTDNQIARVEHWLPTIDRLINAHYDRLQANVSLNELVYQAIEHFAKPRLTPRETELVKIMFEGYSSKQAARMLDISPATERVHRTNIYQKLQINSQCELLRCLLTNNENGKPLQLAG